MSLTEKRHLSQAEIVLNRSFLLKNQAEQVFEQVLH